MKGFKSREPLGGWKCDHCGTDTHTPEIHRENCIETIRANVEQLKTDFAHISEMLEESENEIERLTKCLAVANSNHEHFERLWYLAQGNLEDIQRDMVDAAGERKAEVERLENIILADKHEDEYEGSCSCAVCMEAMRIRKRRKEE